MGVDRGNALIQTFGGDSWVSRFQQAKAVEKNSSDGSAILVHPIPHSLTSAPLRLCASARVLPIWSPALDQSVFGQPLTWAFVGACGWGWRLRECAGGGPISSDDGVAGLGQARETGQPTIAPPEWACPVAPAIDCGGEENGLGAPPYVAIRLEEVDRLCEVIRGEVDPVLWCVLKREKSDFLADPSLHSDDTLAAEATLAIVEHDRFGRRLWG